MSIILHRSVKSKHKCECYDGYVLETDGFTCKRNDSITPYIIFSNRHELRGIDLHTHNVKVQLIPKHISFPRQQFHCSIITELQI